MRRNPAFDPPALASHAVAAGLSLQGVHTGCRVLPAPSSRQGSDSYVVPEQESHPMHSALAVAEHCTDVPNGQAANVGQARGGRTRAHARVLTRAVFAQTILCHVAAILTGDRSKLVLAAVGAGLRGVA